MSRFTNGRRAAIAVWTGAGVVWASTAAVVVTNQTDAMSAEQAPSVELVTITAGVPELPSAGLIVVRSPGEASLPAPSPSEVAPAGEVVEPAPAPPPQPVTSGS